MRVSGCNRGHHESTVHPTEFGRNLRLLLDVMRPVGLTLGDAVPHEVARQGHIQVGEYALLSRRR